MGKQLSIANCQLAIDNWQFTCMQKSFGTLISQLAQVNIALWHEEDKARVDDDHIVAQAKRRIDKLNQQRNDLIEQLDELAVEAISQGNSH